MDTADDLALQQDQEEAQHSKYALLRPSVPLGSECLVRVFFLDTLGTAQQMVLATVPWSASKTAASRFGTPSKPFCAHWACSR